MSTMLDLFTLQPWVQGDSLAGPDLVPGRSLMKRIGHGILFALGLLTTAACGGDGDGLPTAPPSPPRQPRFYVIQVSRCEGTYDWTFDYGIIVGCEVGNSGNACGNATVRLSVEQAGRIMDQVNRSIYACPGDRIYVEETLWGARDSLSPTYCRCEIL